MRDMSRILAFVGYGALGRQIAQMMEEIGHPLCRAERIFFDDYSYQAGTPGAYPFDAAVDRDFRDCQFVVAIGYKHLPEKQNVIHRLHGNGSRLLSVIHPSALISPSAKIEEGCLVSSGCIVDMNTVVSSGCVLYNGCIVAHDNVIGECCFLGPGVTVAGNCRIGERTFLGIRTIVSNDIVCGSDCILGAGSLIQKNLGDKTYGLGNPFSIVSDKLKLI